MVTSTAYRPVLFRIFLIRVGNLQQNRETIDALVFWLYPYLQGCTAILTDTWSISSLAFNASRLLPRIGGEAGRRIAVDMLPQYYDSDRSTEVDIASILGRLLLQGGKVLVLSSACMTNRLTSALKRVMSERGIPVDSVLFLTLYKLGKTSDSAVFCDISEEVFLGSPIRYDDDISNEEIARSVILSIDSKLYFPVAGVVKKISVTKKVIQRDAIDKLGVCGGIAVHRDYAEGGYNRHHGIYIDICPALGEGWFRSRMTEIVDEVLGSVVSIKLIVSPIHKAGRTLAQFMRSILAEREVEVEAYAHDSLEVFGARRKPSERELRQRLEEFEEDDCILIVDDVVITGRRLFRYHRALRNLQFRGRIAYVVAVARPESAGEWHEQAQKLEFRSGHDGAPRDDPNFVRAALEIVLPDWSREQCPWCRELRLYEDIAKKLPPSDIPLEIMDRIEVLRGKRSIGLTGEIFARKRTEPGADRELELGPGSFYASSSVSQASVFASVAAAIHVLRSSNPPKSLSRDHYPFVGVLNWKNMFVDTWTDSILRASFLRVLRGDEYVPRAQDGRAKLMEELNKLITSSSDFDRNIAWEMLLSSRQGRMPGISMSDAARQSLKMRGWGNLVRFFEM